MSLQLKDCKSHHLIARFSTHLRSRSRCPFHSHFLKICPSNHCTSLGELSLSSHGRTVAFSSNSSSEIAGTDTSAVDIVHSLSFLQSPIEYPAASWPCPSSPSSLSTPGSLVPNASSHGRIGRCGSTARANLWVLAPERHRARGPPIDHIEKLSTEKTRTHHHYHATNVPFQKHGLC